MPLNVFAPALALLLAPLSIGIINRTKAFVAGRHGPPLLQTYWDLFKLLRRGAIYGEVTTALVRLGPALNVATLVTALALVPFPGAGAVVGFSGDLIVLVGLF